MQIGAVPTSARQRLRREITCAKGQEGRRLAIGAGPSSRTRYFETFFSQFCAAFSAFALPP
jgi:hypothetical protein